MVLPHCRQYDYYPLAQRALDIHLTEDNFSLAYLPKWGLRGVKIPDKLIRTKNKY